MQYIDGLLLLLIYDNFTRLVVAGQSNYNNKEIN